MPLYDYRCAACGAVTEIRHGFNESHDEPCAACGGKLTRVFNPAPIVFKGSGFYVTDSRSSSGGKTDTAKADTAKADTAKADPPKSDSSKSDSAA
jgi:putative FmdB family regulatory protein